MEHATDHKNAMIAGLWANSNLDDGKNTRNQALESIENSYNETVAIIYSDHKSEEIDFQTDPFFKAMKLPDDPGSVPDRTTKKEIHVDQV